MTEEVKTTLTAGSENDEDLVVAPLQKQDSVDSRNLEQHILNAKSTFNLAINGQVFRSLIENKAKNPSLLTRILGSA